MTTTQATTPASAAPGIDRPALDDVRTAPPATAPAPAAVTPARLPSFDLRAAATTTAAWTAATLLGVALVAYLVGPLIAAREQRALLVELRQDVVQAAGSATDSLLGPAPVTRSTALGGPVALLQVPRLDLQQVVVEGVDPARTRTAPGHVPGTAGVGQPGNAVVVGRGSTWGRAFARLDELRAGDQLVTTTPQGQSLYVVEEVRRDVPVDGSTGDATPTDRLTLLTSSSVLPWVGDRGTVVVAALQTRPFTPTPQNGRSDEQDGRSADPSALPLVVLCLLALGATTAIATSLYRRWSATGTYVGTTPALVALVVFLALATSRLLPAWA